MANAPSDHTSLVGTGSWARTTHVRGSPKSLRLSLMAAAVKTPWVLPPPAIATVPTGHVAEVVLESTESFTPPGCSTCVTPLRPPSWEASRPSTLSALSLETLVEELTARGAPESTSRLRAGPGPLLSNTLTALAKLSLPTLKKSPLAPKAALAAPNTKASMTARPTMNTVALPTHITLEAAFLSISPASFSEGGTRQTRLKLYNASTLACPCYQA